MKERVIQKSYELPENSNVKEIASLPFVWNKIGQSNEFTLP